ncbi:MAG: hypothetical protein EA398_03515 [Deltaproteobacteria bacterium]|nr:MAG: hypothetical protein EA398_03515 [Deltaproteobacteria bacterium]
MARRAVPAEAPRNPREACADETVLFEGASDAVLGGTFAGALRGRLAEGESVRAWSFASPTDARLVIEVADAGRERVLWMECGMAFGAGVREAEVAMAVLAEFLHDRLADHLAQERWPPPHLDFKEYEHGEWTVYFRGQEHNEALDHLADEWLRRHGDGPLSDGGDS